jgi:uncharacterized protein (DUF1330 family)
MKTLIRSFLLVLFFVGSASVSVSTAQTQDAEELVLVDLAVMNEPYDQAERDVYSAKTEEIAKQYGIKKAQSYRIIKYLDGQGPQDALELNLWTYDDPDDMQKFSSDPEYKARIPLRNVLHDMDALTLYTAKPKLQGAAPNPSQFVLVDFAVMNEDFGQAERDTYVRETERIAAKYGAKRFASYHIVQHLGGAGPEDVLVLDLWAMDDPSALQKLSSDPEYKANVPERNKIHNMEALTLYLAKAKAASAREDAGMSGMSDVGGMGGM